jgi:phosphate uptake regulator
MFQKFKELFSSESLLDSAFATTITMLEFDRKMYQAARDTLRDADTAELPFDVRQTDRRINKYEREVRRNVLTHLAVAGTANLTAGLALISVVIDVERIGDYTKNIVDLASRHPAKLHGGSHETALLEIEAEVARQFDQIIPILKDHNQEAGRQIMAIEEKIARKSEAIVSAMITEPDPGMSTQDAVAVAMYARYLKRINAHLTNIASAIVNPFPRIGFREKNSDKINGGD